MSKKSCNTQDMHDPPTPPQSVLVQDAGTKS